MRTLFGLLRSLAVYYGVPLRTRKMRAFYSRFIGPRDIAFDIGSHVGNRIRPWLQLGATVVAVEPQPACRPILRALYGRHPRVRLVWAAVSNSNSDSVLHLSRRHPTLATLSSRWVERAAISPGFAHVEWDGSVRVRTRTLDQLISDHGVPAFIKIDVEGFEDRVIESLSRPVAALSFEYLAADPAVAQRCISHLESLAAYRYNVCRGESLRPLFADWIDADSMSRYLRQLPLRAASGDVYARLAQAQPCKAQPRSG